MTICAQPDGAGWAAIWFWGGEVQGDRRSVIGTGFLAVACLRHGCSGERTIAMTNLATFSCDRTTVGEVVRRMRCSRGCGGRVGAAWLMIGPVLNMRVRPRRVALRGPEARANANRNMPDVCTDSARALIGRLA
jgi:hypothetical protein